MISDEPPLLVSSSETTTLHYPLNNSELVGCSYTVKLENAPRIYFCAANILMIIY